MTDSDAPTSTTETGTTTTKPKLFGRVIDSQTRKGLAGAQVTLVAKGTVTQINSGADPTPNDLFDDAGYFVFSDVPDGDHRLKVGASDYSPFETTITITADTDMGTIALGKPFDLEVLITAEGLPVPDGVSVYAFGTSTTAECSGTGNLAASTGEIFSLTSGSDGSAILSSADSCTAYTITIPSQNISGDYYKTALLSYGGITNSGDKVSIALAKALPDDTIGILDTNLDVTAFTIPALNITDTGLDPGTTLDSTTSPAIATTDTTMRIGSNDPIRIIFNFPISVGGGVTASYLDDLRDPDADNNDALDTGFPLTAQVNGLTTSLSAGNTVLTITPPSTGFPANETILLKGIVSASILGVETTSDLGSLLDIINNPIYIVNPINSGTIPTADNYNGSATGGTAAIVYLEFTTYVSGSFRIISITKSGQAKQVINGDSISTPQSGDGLVFTDGTLSPACNNCGTGAGTLYRVNTGQSLTDGDTIEVAYTVTDLNGNVASSSSLSLIVQ